MKSFEIINNLFNGNFDELKTNIFSDLKIVDKKLTYDNNLHLSISFFNEKQGRKHYTTWNLVCSYTSEAIEGEFHFMHKNNF